MPTCILLRQKEQSRIEINENENNATTFMQIIHEATQYQQGIAKYGISIPIYMCTDYITTLHPSNILQIKINNWFTLNNTYAPRKCVWIG